MSFHEILVFLLFLNFSVSLDPRWGNYCLKMFFTNMDKESMERTVICHIIDVYDNLYKKYVELSISDTRD